jgi:hypothetical protein
MSRRPATRTDVRRPTQAGPRTTGTRRTSSSGPITPFRVVVVLALVGSLAYLAFAITVRDASQIPMLSSGAAVLGIVFVVVALGGAVSSYRAGIEGRGGRAVLTAAFAGFAAIAAAGSFSAAIVLALVWQA